MRFPKLPKTKDEELDDRARSLAKARVRFEEERKAFDRALESAVKHDRVDKATAAKLRAAALKGA